MVRSYKKLLFPALTSIALWATVTTLIFGLVVVASSATPSIEQTPTIVSQPSDSVRVIDSRPSQPARIRTCSIHQELLTPENGQIRVAVSSSADLLFEADASTQVTPASVTKLFTAVAAFNVLGPDHRLSTKVFLAPSGEVWVYGGGDLTLSRTEGPTYYENPSRLGALVAASVDTGRIPGDVPLVVHVDDSRYQQFDSWDPSWRRGSAGLGFVSPVTSFQLDGDRDNPSGRLSPRSMDPLLRAHTWVQEAFARALPGVDVRAGSLSVVPDDAVLIAEVRSPEVRDLVGQMLLDSDNSLAEVLAREVALALGSDSIGDGLVEGITIFDNDATPPVFQDGSGLSPKNLVSAHQVVQLLEYISREAALKEIADSLPLAGETGSLRLRFVDSSNPARGIIHAKTGTLTGVSSLAGYITHPGGEAQAFSISLSGPEVSQASRVSVDALAEAIVGCGDNLAPAAQ